MVPQVSTICGAATVYPARYIVGPAISRHTDRAISCQFNRSRSHQVSYQALWQSPWPSRWGPPHLVVRWGQSRCVSVTRWFITCYLTCLNNVKHDFTFSIMVITYMLPSNRIYSAALDGQATPQLTVEVLDATGSNKNMCLYFSRHMHGSQYLRRS